MPHTALRRLTRVSRAAGLALVALLSLADPAAAAPPKKAPSLKDPIDLTGLPPAPPVYPRLAAREGERRTAATELLAKADLPTETRTTLMAQRAMSSLALGDLAAAITDLHEATRIDPRDPSSHLMLARVLWFAGREDDAQRFWQQASRLARKNRVVQELGGTMAYGRGDWTPAAKDLDTAYQVPRDESARPYAALLAHLALRRAHGPTSNAATEALRDVARQDTWPRPIAEALLGQVDAEALEALAVHPDPMVQRTWRTELQFYLGERAAIDGRIDEATTRLGRVLALGLPHENEYHLARLRLAALGAPVAPEAITLEEEADAPAAGERDEDGWAWSEDSAFDREVNRLIRSGAVRLAITRLRDQKSAGLSEERMRTLANLLLRTGQSEEGLTELRATLRGDESDVPLLGTIGWVELVSALELGVDGKSSGVSRYLSAAMDPWRFQARKAGEKHLENARTAFERARLLKPDDLDLTRTTARVMEFAGERKGAVILWRLILERQPEDDDAIVSLARCLAADNQTAEARSVVNPVLERHPNHAAAHAVAAEILRRRGKPEDARKHADWADFASRLPPDSPLQFTPENVAALKRIEIVPVQYLGMQLLQVAQTRKSTVSGWMADKDNPTATALLAAALWIPERDLDKAVAIARELHARGDVATLRTILDRSEDIVAAGAAARVLAEAGETGIFERLRFLLMNDDDLRSVGDIAGALAASRDTRATLHLVNILDPGFESSPRLAVDRAAPILGYNAARARAALALAAFDTDHAQDALEAGLATPEIALHCRAALFVLTGERVHFDAIRSALRYGVFHEMARTFTVLEGTGDAEAAELAAAYRKRSRR